MDDSNATVVFGSPSIRQLSLDIGWHAHQADSALH
jgi:hypothetical protein